MTKEGDKPRRKGKTGRAKTSEARRIEPSDDVRLGDKLTRSREPGDPSPLEQLRRMEGWKWAAVERAGEAMRTVELPSAKDINSLLRATQVMVELSENLRSTVETLREASVETEFEVLTDEQQALYAELYPELFATAPAPDGPAN